MNVSLTTPTAPSQAGSATPGLEGAPCSASHENRIKSVIPGGAMVPPGEKEGSPSKP